jgi:hypothetical protein
MPRSSPSEYDKAHVEDIIRGDGDWFGAKLIRLIRDADADNRETLREAYPEHVQAFEEWYAGTHQSMDSVVFKDEITDLYDEIMRVAPHTRSAVEERFIEFVGGELAAEVERTSRERD